MTVAELLDHLVSACIHIPSVKDQPARTADGREIQHVTVKAREGIPAHVTVEPEY